MADRPLALVTGASRGFGAALAEALGARGWHVIAVARTVGGLEDLDDRIKIAGGATTLAPMDVTDTEAMRHLCRSIHERWGKLDLWAHTAIHAAPLSPVDHMGEKDWQKTVATNIDAPGTLIPFVAPLLAAATGIALHVDDQPPAKFHAPYAASKAAQRALYDAWATETAKTGTLRVARVTPRPMPTALRARFYPGEDRAALTAPGDEAARALNALGLA